MLIKYGFYGLWSLLTLLSFGTSVTLIVKATQVQSGSCCIPPAANCSLPRIAEYVKAKRRRFADARPFFSLDDTPMPLFFRSGNDNACFFTADEATALGCPGLQQMTKSCLIDSPLGCDRVDFQNVPVHSLLPAIAALLLTPTVMQFLGLVCLRGSRVGTDRGCWQALLVTPFFVASIFHLIVMCLAAVVAFSHQGNEFASAIAGYCLKYTTVGTGKGTRTVCVDQRTSRFESPNFTISGDTCPYAGGIAHVVTWSLQSFDHHAACAFVVALSAAQLLLAQCPWPWICCCDAETEALRVLD